METLTKKRIGCFSDTENFSADKMLKTLFLFVDDFYNCILYRTLLQFNTNFLDKHLFLSKDISLSVYSNIFLLLENSTESNPIRKLHKIDT